MNKKVYCENCKYYKLNHREKYIDPKFKEETPDKDFVDPRKRRKNHYTIHCQHFSCFKHDILVEESCIKINIIETIQRIKGCYQLNKNNDCKYYKKKWYKFWV